MWMVIKVFDEIVICEFDLFHDLLVKPSAPTPTHDLFSLS